MNIYHITKYATWLDAKNLTSYENESLLKVGFIHCCLFRQIDFVLNNWFVEKEDLVILKIDTDKLISPVVMENLEGKNELFPHIYGPINTSAIIDEIQN